MMYNVLCVRRRSLPDSQATDIPAQTVRETDSNVCVFRII